MKRNHRLAFLTGLMAAFGTGYVTGEPGPDKQTSGPKKGPDSKTRRKRRKAQRQARKRGR